MSDKIERGAQAEHLLTNTLLNEVLGTLEASYIDAWKAADTVEAREDCHRYVVLAATIKADLQSIANTGALERKRQDELAGRPTSIHMPLRRANG